ncbi:MAG: BolA family protein [Mizugakiibacter sp.]|uniref:BolA family protein n=1 Tax=Mizugakiibacter sp. TaxID=1972610 RepID=UPI0031C7194D|nr:BolA family transcriptional regulator [Xanthomonadaceae bacterium]
MSGDRAALIRERVEAALAPLALEVIDEGHLHIGHAGEGQGHFRVRVTSEAFAGKTPIQRHRLVYAAVGDLIPARLHALAIEAHAPGER